VPLPESQGIVESCLAVGAVKHHNEDSFSDTGEASTGWSGYSCLEAFPSHAKQFVGITPYFFAID